MDLKTLKTFQAIVKYGSFNRAAEEMNYAQSTVTMQIHKLEKDLGTQLIERGKVLQLTEAGRLFYEESLEIVKRMEQLQENIADMHLGEAGSVRVGVTEPTASDRLPGLLQQFMAKNPKVRVAVEIASTATLVGQLMSGDIDFAICSSPDLGAELYYEPLFYEEFVAIMPEGHLLAKKESIEPRDMQGHRLLITSSTCPYRRKLEVILKEAGQISIDTMEIGSMLALKSYVASGFGMALVPRILLNPMPEGVISRPMADSEIHMLMGLVCKTSEYPFKHAAGKLYQFLEQGLRENSEIGPYSK